MRKILYIVVLGLILVCLFSLGLEIHSVRRVGINEDEHFVGIPGGFSSIQEAIDNATDNDVIQVLAKASPYKETITVYKSVRILRYWDQPPQSIPVVEGANVSKPVFNVTAPNVEISGFNITNGKYGILLVSSFNKITNNTVTSNGMGIFIGELSASNYLRRNKIAGNTLNFGVDSTEYLFTKPALSHFLQDIDISNTVEGRPIYYLVNRTDETIQYNAGYIAIVNSTRITIKNMSLRGNIQSVLVAFSSQVRVEDSVFLNPMDYSHIPEAQRDGYEGAIAFSNANNSIVQNVTFLSAGRCISLQYSTNNTIQNNQIIFSIDDNFNHRGIKLFRSTNTSVLNNVIRNAHPSVELGWGLVLDYCVNTSVLANFIDRTFSDLYMCKSNGSIFVHNKFFKYANRGVAFCYNTRFDDGYEGNYWPDYSGADSNHDGIGDSCYQVSGISNYDCCPLMEPWNSTRTIDVTHAKNPIESCFVMINCEHVVAAYEYTPNWTGKTGSITFNITSSCLALCKVAIPRSRLDAPLKLYINSTLVDPLNYSSYLDEEFCYLEFSFPLGKSKVKIVGCRISMFCDINGDGIVDITDIYRVIAEYGNFWTP